jgi:hypothetical protein
METMVERVTAALLAEVTNPEPMPDAEYAKRLARLAIEAMREPTVEMKLAGVEAESYRSLGLLKVSHIWNSMIKAALEKTTV